LEVLCIAAYVSLKFQAFLWRDFCLWVRVPFSSM
jgi:hypothetical protein